MQEQIIQIIQDLLQEHNYVIIPQLGGFISKYQSAQIIPEKNIILPPSKKISFNAELKDDDGLLINTLAKQENIATAKAEQIVNQFVQDIFIRLDNSKTVIFDKIGAFKFNQQLNIEFEVVTSENYNPHSYGMVSVSCVTLSDNELTEVTNKKIVTRRNLMRVAVILPFLIVGTVLSIYLHQIGFFSSISTHQQQETASVIPLNTDKQEENSSLESPNTIEKAIDFKTKEENALAYVEPKTNVSDKKNESNLELVKEVSIEETVEPKEEAIQEDISLQDKNELKVEEKVKEEIPVQSLKYQLVAGSFKSQSNANRLSKKIQKLDYQAQVIKQGNRYRVIAVSFASKSDAIKTKKALKKQAVSTWINTLK